MMTKTADKVRDRFEDGDKPLRILYAEDCENNVMLVRFYLKGTEYSLDAAANGMEAVRMFTRDPYDVVLMDIQMPIMDGYEATRAIREWEKEQGRPPVPVITVTAHALDENRRRSHEAGSTVFLTKPVRKAVLLETIRQACGIDGCARPDGAIHG